MSNFQSPRAESFLTDYSRIEESDRLEAIIAKAGLAGEVVGQRFLVGVASGWAVLDLRCEELIVDQFGAEESRRLLLDAPSSEPVDAIARRLRHEMDVLRPESHMDAVDGLRRRFWARAESSFGFEGSSSSAVAYRFWATERRLSEQDGPDEAFSDSWYQRTSEWCSGDLRLDG